MAMGCTFPDGRDPALATSTNPPAAALRKASAIWLRQEFPVQRMRIRGWFIGNPRGAWQLQSAELLEMEVEDAADLADTLRILVRSVAGRHDLLGDGALHV